MGDRNGDVVSGENAGSVSKAFNASRECSFSSTTDKGWDTLRVNACPTDSGVGHLPKRIEPGAPSGPRLRCRSRPWVPDRCMNHFRLKMSDTDQVPTTRQKVKCVPVIAKSG